ncbi:MAG: hypothetical protein FD180_3211 [Planctomycetota bacterium]|nr:MAG: hypothetical protein FD180_3211 [Planctomycetota bacterium]
MRLMFAASALAVLALAVVADDKVGKTTAPALFTKSATELRKIPGYHFTYSGSVGEQSLDTTGITWVSGLVKQTTKQGTDIWRREKTAFAKDKTGKYVGAASLGQAEQAVVGSPTPDALLVEALGVAKNAKYNQDEELDGKDCKVIECEAPQAKLKEYMEAAAKYYRPEYAGFIKNLPLEEKESYMIYRIFISKEDLVIRRIVRDTKIVIAESAMKGRPELAAAGGRMDQVLTVELKKHGEGLDEEVPAEIKKLLQVK